MKTPGEWMPHIETPTPSHPNVYARRLETISAIQRDARDGMIDREEVMDALQTAAAVTDKQLCLPHGGLSSLLRAKHPNLFRE